jgi:carboxymethylenebutenolidase
MTGGMTRGMTGGMTSGTTIAVPITALQGTMVDVVLSDGGCARAYLAGLADIATPKPGIVVIHEWFGLNDQIRQACDALASAGYVVLGADLYRGALAADVDRARVLIGQLDEAHALDALSACCAYLRALPGCTGKLAALGFCLGGGWALNLAIAAEVDAAVIYYGNVERSSAQVSAIACPLLAHFGTRDAVFTPDTVRRFADQLQAGGKSLELHWYDAAHAFANPYRPNYDAHGAVIAWQRTLAFLRQRLAEP